MRRKKWNTKEEILPIFLWENTEKTQKSKRNVLLIMYRIEEIHHILDCCYLFFIIIYRYEKKFAIFSCRERNIRTKTIYLTISGYSSKWNVWITRYIHTTGYTRIKWSSHLYFIVVLWTNNQARNSWSYLWWGIDKEGCFFWNNNRLFKKRYISRIRECK